MIIAKKKYGFDPDYAIPPGETLREVMESLDMSQKELAKRTGLTVQSLNRIFKGEQPVSYETANRLELATGVSANMWNNLEAQYREQLAKIHERKRLAVDFMPWLEKIPVDELVRRGVLPKSDDKVFLLRDVLKFYGVSSVDGWRQIWEAPAVAARRSQCFDTCPGSASAWLRQGEIKAHKLQCAIFDKKTFRKALIKIRALTVKSPEKFEPRMKRLCAKSGVAFVLVPEMKKVPWHGATQWLSPTKAMILLNLRFKSDDQFWFSFFHEAGHVLHDSKKDLLINDGSKNDPREQQADDFAADFLIPSNYTEMIKNARSHNDIKSIAKELGIAPGIVVGRYQFLTHKWNMFNRHKQKFEWVNNG